MDAVIARDWSSGRVTDVEFLQGGGSGPEEGSIGPVAAGTKIHILNVERKRDPELGVIVRVYAKIASGPYEGAVAILYSISVQKRATDGKMSDLGPDPALIGRIE
ncbi:MAG TPA: hypothetical protein VGG34_01125 [Opitutaceae bacterium]|jgi:hypothetical protein